VGPSTTAFHAELEKEVGRYLDRIRQIDRILQRPINTLIRVSYETVFKRSGSPVAQSFYFPALLSGQFEPQQAHNPLTQALCFATLQRLWRRRRRFAWLEKSDQLGKLLGEPKEPGHGNAPNPLLGCFMPPDKSGVADNLTLLQSDVFGGLNPYTAAQVFRVLVDAGEAQAHSGLGCLAFFAMVWPLYRRHPESHSGGARIEPWHPTAYVTANCLLPILGVKSIANRRAEALEDIAKNLAELHRLTSKEDPRSHWLFNVQLDALSANLLRLSELAIVKEVFAKCAEEVAAESVGLSADDEIKSYAVVYAKVLQKLAAAIQQTGQRSLRTLQEAQTAVDSIGQTVHNAGKLSNRLKAFGALEKEWGLRFPEEFKSNTACQKAYWRDVAGAADKAIKLTRGLLDALAQAATLCSACKVNGIEATLRKIETEPRSVTVLLKPHFKTVHDTLLSLGRTNRAVAKRMGDAIEAPARWCHSVVDREIAHASAGNLTDFDPSELVSAIAVAVRCKLMTTSLQVTDAIGKAILGVQQDGSWQSGQPFYSPDGALGIWPVTSDIVWTLAATIEQQPDVNIADEKLFLYVDWLERTIIEVPIRTPGKREPAYTGWASDRLRHRRKIHLATTAYSVNALFEIRELAEYRLWELCKKRFATPTVTVQGLAGVDPVDLGATHEHRLHSQLAQMARLAQEADTNAAYSLVLHGPPGSSKTRLAEALSVEMWKTSRPWGSKEPRLIRVTPADFTRLGEDRIDSEARLIFELLGHVRAVTILFDEIDDLLRRRNQDLPTRFMDLVVPAMLNRLADLRDICPRHEICFLLATNYIENIERALIRKGRIDRAVAVVYPDETSRQAQVHSHLQPLHRYRRKDIQQMIKPFVKGTKGWPWMTINVTCKEIVSQLNKDTGWKELADKAVRDNEGQFSQPHYQTRLDSDKSRSPELRDEYLRFIICSCAGPQDLDKEMSSIETLCRRWGLSPKDIHSQLQSIIATEGRKQDLPIPDDFLERVSRRERTKATPPGDAISAPREFGVLVKESTGEMPPANVPAGADDDKVGARKDEPT
jgi:SpoVK/Ycf46/Vps4 family AAA+-type ATPase